MSSILGLMAEHREDYADRLQTSLAERKAAAANVVAQKEMVPC